MKKTIAIAAFALFALTVSAQTPNKGRPTLNHIALYVVNLEEATHFYRDVVGLDTIPEPFHDGRHTWFSIGGPNSHLHLIQGAKVKSEHDKNIHNCFSVPSVEDFIKILDKNKIPYENWPGEKQTITNRVDGIKQLWCKDPDGYWVEINNDYK